jgi:hypothetical protein
MKLAILLNGAVSRVTGKFDNPGQLYRPGEYINYTAVYNSIQRHIVESNPGWQVDFFAHCWNTDLADALNNLYQFRASQFEDNNQYQNEINEKLHLFGAAMKQYAFCSRTMSVKKVCELVENHVAETGADYDLVMLYRPDVLLWRDIRLGTYDLNTITCNSRTVMKEYSGDFHHIMNLRNMSMYKFRYKTNNYPAGWTVDSHNSNSAWMKLLQHSGISIAMDEVEAGIHQAPVRYINAPVHELSAISQGYITLEQLMTYGFTAEEIDSYTTIWGDGVRP